MSGFPYPASNYVPTVPGSNTSPGIAGQWAADSAYLYVCYRNNNWARTVWGSTSFRFFDQATIAGLKLWLKADTLVLTDGTAVSSWTDSSINGNHAVQATGTKQPLFKISVWNNMPAIRFDGSNDNMYAPVTVGQGAHTIFFVAKHVGLPNAYNPVISYATNNTENGTDLGFVQSVKSSFAGGMYPLFGLSGNAAVDPTTGTYAVQTPYIYVLTFATGGNWVGYKNGVQESTAAAVTYAASQLYLQIGAQIVSGVSRPSQVDILEILAYDSVLSTENRQLGESYLNGRYRIY